MDCSASLPRLKVGASTVTLARHSRALVGIDRVTVNSRDSAVLVLGSDVFASFSRQIAL
jgi:hypothetical protein